MFEVFNPRVIVCLTTPTYGDRLEQIYLDRDEQAAVLGFIKEMKKLNNKDVEIINGATNFVRGLNVANSNWDSIERIVTSYNDRVGCSQ
jgi:hypothetical protein